MLIMEIIFIDIIESKKVRLGWNVFKALEQRMIWKI